MNVFKLILLLNFLLCQLSIASSDVVHIGVILRLTDKYNTFVNSIKEGIEFSLEKSGSTKKIKMSYYNHDGSFQTISRAISKMDKDGVDIIIGAETSSDAIQISRLTKNSKIPFITPTASSHKMFKFNSNTFRISHDDKNVYKTVDYIVERLKIKNINIYHNVSKPNTDHIARTIKLSLDEKKIKYVSKEFLSDSKISLDEIKSFLRNKTNVICLYAFESDLRKVFEHYKKEGVPMIYLGADGWGSNKGVYNKYIKQIDNKDLFTGIRIMYWDETRKDDFFKNTKNGLGKKFQKKVNEFHSIGYDAMSIILQALKRNDYQYKKDKFLKELRTGTFSDLLTSKEIKFDFENAPLKDMYLYKIDKSGIHKWGTVR